MPLSNQIINITDVTLRYQLTQPSCCYWGVCSWLLHHIISSKEGIECIPLALLVQYTGHWRLSIHQRLYIHLYCRVSASDRLLRCCMASIYTHRLWRCTQTGGRSSMYRSVDIIICLAISGRQMDQLVVALTIEARSMVRGPPMPAAAAVKVCHGGTFY